MATVDQRYLAARQQYASGRFGSQAEVKRFFESHPEFPICRHGYLTNEQVNRILTRLIYVGSLLSDLFSKRWDEAEMKVKETRAAMKLEIAAIEKKVAHFLDRIVESDSATVIGAYERKVDELEHN